MSPTIVYVCVTWGLFGDTEGAGARVGQAYLRVFIVHRKGKCVFKEEELFKYQRE